MVSTDISQNANRFDINRNNSFYSYILDIIDTNIYKTTEITPKKTYKQLFIIKFDSKYLEVIPYSKIFS